MGPLFQVINFPIWSSSERLRTSLRTVSMLCLCSPYVLPCPSWGKIPRGAFHPKLGPFNLVSLPVSVLPYSEHWPSHSNLIAICIFADLSYSPFSSPEKLSFHFQTLC